MSLLKDVVGYGTHAARPAAGSEGRLYYETDTTTLFRDNGTTWDALSLGGGSSGLVPIDSIALDTGPASNIAFNAIPGGYASLLIKGWLRTTEVNWSTTCAMLINGDTGANYDWDVFYVFSGFVSSSASLGQTYINIGDASAANAPAGDFSAVEIWLPAYDNTHMNKTWKAYIGLQGEYTVSHLGQERLNGYWNSTAAITALDIFPGAAQFAQYSRLSLYGLT